MNKIPYALAMSMLALAAAPGAAAEPTEVLATLPSWSAELTVMLVPGGSPEPPAPGVAPCHWFDYSITPPGYRLRVRCLVETALDLLP